MLWIRTGFLSEQVGCCMREKESGKGKTFSYTKEVVDVKIVCIKRKGDVFCEPAAAWASERSACLYLCGGDESLF